MLACFCLLGAGTLFAQLPDYHLQLFNHTSGIRPGNINKVVKDTKGFVWISYPRQIQRFNGRKVDVFKAGGSITGLFCDTEGRVWAQTGKSISKFNEERQNFEQTEVESEAATDFGGMFQTPDKQLHVLGGNGLYRYDDKRCAFVQSYKLPVPLPYGVRIFAHKAWTIFFAHDSSIYRYDLLTKKTAKLPNRNLMVMFEAGEDSLLASSWSGNSYWYNFRSGTITPVTSPDKVKNEPEQFFGVRSMARFASNRYFLITNTGIYEYDAATHQYKKLSFFLDGRRVATNDYVKHISLDDEGFAWMASVDGVARFSYKQQQPIGLIRVRQASDELPLAVDNVRKMVEDDEGNLWLATGYGIVSWNKKKGSWQMFPPAHNREDRLAFPSVRGLVYDGKYLILGPTDLGTWLFDVKTHRYKRPLFDNEETRRYNHGDFVDDIYTLRNGNHLIMGRDRLYLLNGKTYRMTMPDVPAAKENTNYAFEGADGIIWITTSKGLHCLDSNLKQLENLTPPTRDKSISAGFMLPDNRLLFSTTEGLFTAQYSKGKAVVKKFTNLFDRIFVLTLYQDDNGIIWATSEDGIYRFDPRLSKLNVFDYSDNVQGYGFNGNSWFKTKAGYLFFGGINGINYLKPEHVSAVNEKLQVYINHAKVGDSDSLLYRFKAPVDVGYANRTIEVSLVSPYFNNPDKVKYRYKLEGFDEEWKFLDKTHFLRFSSLAPGSYNLVVEGSINGADWVRAANQLSFRIKPPYWLTWWFVSGCAVVTALLLWWLIASRSKRLRQKQEELETEQAINHFASSLYQHQSVDAILWDVARNCISRLQFEDCVIYLLDKKKKVLVQKAAYGPKSPKEFQLIEPLEIPVGRGITGSVALSGKPELIDDTSKDNRYIVDDEPRLSEITVPIVFGQEVLGVIDCEHSKKRFFTQKHLSVLTTIASLCANKIVRVRAEEERRNAEQVLTDTKQKMAEAEMQALRAQMNPHFIFNCLNSINRYIVKSDGQTASLYLTRFAKLIRLILDNSNSKSVTLSNELEALRLYIEMESIRFEKKFRYQIKVGSDIQPDSVYVPPLIIQPYVENAIWHGLLHKETAGELKIHLYKKTPSLLECIIEDNGVGREKAKELKSKSASQKKSLGMRLTEDRLALLNTAGIASAAIEVEDLKNTEGSAAGTKVVLRIPIDND